MFKSITSRVHDHPFWSAALIIPYVLLIALHSVNPWLREHQEATYCPTPAEPTVLEESMGIFPSPITEWVGYAIWYLVMYLIVLTVVRVRAAAKRSYVERMESGVDEEFVTGPSTFKIIAPFLWAILGIFSVGVIMALAAAAGDRYWFPEFVVSLLTFMNAYMIPIVLLGGIVMFIFGAYQYVIPGLDGDKVARRKGRVRMFFSVLIGVCIITAWGVITLMTSSVGLSDSSGPYAPNMGIGEGTIALSDLGTDSVSGETIGFSVGGAKDADNFRENIEQCYLPIPTDITYEGLFYDYIFETKNTTGCTALFCPQYEGAVVADPFSGQDEYFLSVGLGSNIAADTFKRPPLDIVVVIDISGSMSSSFDRYYYDQFRDQNKKADPDADWNRSKMEIAKEAMGAMADRLHPDDRFGLVVFESSARTVLAPFTMGQNGYAKAKNSIATLSPRGGTNMAAGLEEGTRLIKSLQQEEGVDREKRIIFLTDAMPNTGAVEQNDLYKIGQRNAAEGIHTTFIGVGVDFNTELVEALTKQIQGANYYAIHSSKDFEKRLDIEFEYMVAPLVFDLTLQIEGGDYEIRTVYGSPEAHLATGEILKVSTLFPSPSHEGSSRGGVILAHMKKVRDTGAPTRVIAGYTDRAGQQFVEPGIVEWSQVTGESASKNVRKAVVLARYANLMQNWLMDENSRLGRHEKTIYSPVRALDFYHGGMIIPAERYPDRTVTFTPYELNYWERLSRDLVVSEDYKQLFHDFRKHMETEIEGVSEEDRLRQELQLLENLENSPDSGYEPPSEEEKGVSRQ